MRTNFMYVLFVALLTLTAASVAAQGADVVYVANPAEGAIYAVDPLGGLDQTPDLLFEEKKFDIGDMVVGPDDLLYVCAPDEGIVFFFDPLFEPPGGYPYSLATVIDLDQVLDTTGIAAPQCGWFSDKGDLFLSDRNSSTAVWIYQDLVPLADDAPPAQLIELVAASGVFYGFAGQGITQAAPGDLLFIDQANGTVGTLAFDPIFRFDAPDSPGPMIDFGGLDHPVGVARIADGTVFVTSGDEVISYGTTPCSVDFTFSGQTPQFMQVTAEDILYVASTSKKSATLWQIDAADCQGPNEIFTFAKPDHKPSLSGIALPRTNRTADPDPNAPNPPVTTDPEFYFNFKDHAYELSFIPESSCESVDSVFATEVRPDCLTRLFDQLDENGDLIPGYIYDDDNDLGTTVFGVPVPYAGDGAVAQLYTLDGDCGDPGPDAVQHAISAYTALIDNPRIVRCVFPEGTDFCAVELPPYCEPDDQTGCTTLAYCELITLESFFPFNGVFPDDGRIGGLSSTTTSDFSEYFIADIALADGSFENTPGCFCGWEDPLPDIDYIDPADPSFGLPSYNSGSAVPIKFRVAVLPDGETCADDDPCDGAPYGYVTGAQILLSVAKIYDWEDEPDFVPISPTATSANTPGNIFGNPTSPSTPFHYNLDTTGFEPGVYQAVAVALTDNFRVEWTYFAIH